MEKRHDNKKCPMCLRRIHDEKTISCGHSFCGPCIMIYWVQEKSMTCPQCTGMCPHRPMSSREFKNFTEFLKIPIVEEVPPEDPVLLGCSKHQEALNLFCLEDMAFICEHCTSSFEHREHFTLTIEEATRRFKILVKSKIGTLKSEKKGNRAARLYAQIDINNCLEKLEEEIDLFTQEFEQLRQFEEEQKGVFLGQLKALQKEMEEAKKAIADCFAERFDSLSTQIRNNEELCQKTGIPFLQDLQKNGDTDVISLTRPCMHPPGVYFTTQDQNWSSDGIKGPKSHRFKQEQNKQKSRELCQKHAAYSRRNNFFKKIMENFRAQVTSCIQQIPKPTVPVKKVPDNRSHIGITHFERILSEDVLEETFISAEIGKSLNDDSSAIEVEILSDDDSTLLFEAEEMVTSPDDDFSVLDIVAN